MRISSTLWSVAAVLVVLTAPVFVASARSAEGTQRVVVFVNDQPITD
jgi:hypothetical protein